MRRTYSMMASSSTQMTREYHQRNQQLNDIPAHLPDIFPFLELLDISQNLLTERAIPKLIELIDALPTLKHINITQNEIPAYAIIQLHDFVVEKNEYRESRTKIVIVSEFSLWHDATQDYPIARYLWQLSPQQWMHTRDPFMCLNALSLEIRDKPSRIQHYQNAFVAIFNTPCTTDWTLFACLCICIHPSLIVACMKVMKPKPFLAACIELFQRMDIPDFDANAYAPAIVFWCFLEEAKSPALAQQFAQAVFTRDSAEKEMSLGYIARFENDYEVALQHFKNGSDKNCAVCHLELAYFMQNNHCPNTYPYIPEKVEALLLRATQDQRLLAEADLAFFYENSQDMVKAFEYYKKARLKLESNAFLKEQIHRDTRYAIENRIQFRKALLFCVDTILDARLERHLLTYPPNLPAWTTLLRQTLKAQHKMDFGLPAVTHLLQELGSSLLKCFKEDDKIFDSLRISLLHIIRLPGEQTLNSFASPLFCQALTEQVRIFLTSRLGANMRLARNI